MTFRSTRPEADQRHQPHGLSQRLDGAPSALVVPGDPFRLSCAPPGVDSCAAAPLAGSPVLGGGAVSAQVLPGHRFSGRHHRPAGSAHAPDTHRRLRHLVGPLGLAGLGVERLSGLVATPARSRSAGEHAAADGNGGRGSRRRLALCRQPIYRWRTSSRSSRLPPLSASPRSAP